MGSAPPRGAQSPGAVSTQKQRWVLVCWGGGLKLPKNLQIFIKYLTTFNLSHYAIYNGINRDVLCFNFKLNPHPPPWPVSRSLLHEATIKKRKQPVVFGKVPTKHSWGCSLAPERRC